jgi:uncharacterized protein YkwD
VYVILVIAVVWLLLAVLVLAILRSAAQADRAEERRRRERRAARRAPDVRRTALLLAAVPLAAAAAGAPDATAGDCANGRRAPGGSAGPRATLCLINSERRARKLPTLAVNPRLARAARRHARDMVVRRYFGHISPGGGTFLSRLRHVGYPGGCAWSAGETIAWASGGGPAAPAARVRAWMRSAPHRQILLDHAYREVGIGIKRGAPDGSPGGFTYVAEFGRRRC